MTANSFTLRNMSLITISMAQIEILSIIQILVVVVTPAKILQTIRTNSVLVKPLTFSWPSFAIVKREIRKQGTNYLMIYLRVTVN